MRLYQTIHTDHEVCLLTNAVCMVLLLSLSSMDVYKSGLCVHQHNVHQFQDVSTVQLDDECAFRQWLQKAAEPNPITEATAVH